MRHLITTLLVAATSVLSTAPAHADLGDQLAKLLADDGAAEDRFGRSVAISGAIALIGARDDDNGTLHLIYFKGDVGKGDLYFMFSVSRAPGFR